MTLRDIFNNFIDFDLTTLPGIIISLIIAIVILTIGWTFLKMIFESVFNFFTENEKGRKILKWFTIIFFLVFFLFFIFYKFIINFFRPI